MASGESRAQIGPQTSSLQSNQTNDASQQIESNRHDDNIPHEFNSQNIDCNDEGFIDEEAQMLQMEQMWSQNLASKKSSKKKTFDSDPKTNDSIDNTNENSNDNVSQNKSKKSNKKKKKKASQDSSVMSSDRIQQQQSLETQIKDVNSSKQEKNTNLGLSGTTSQVTKKGSSKLSKAALILQKRQASERERQRIEEEEKAKEELRLKLLQEEQERLEKLLQQQKIEKKLKEKENKKFQKEEEERRLLLEKKERFSSKQTIVAPTKVESSVKEIYDNSEIYSVDDIAKLSGLNIDKSLRSPVVCVLGHVDTGKTKMLDQLRCTKVQDNEAGGITQQIGATNVTAINIQQSISHVKFGMNKMLRLPGILLIDTPGHESFSNLRARGTSLCDIAILIVDITHGLEQQTLESIDLLRNSKTPFVIALNKIDAIFGWKTRTMMEIYDVIEEQNSTTKSEFDDLYSKVFTQFAERNINVSLFYDKNRMASSKDMIPIVPTSAITGEGVADLLSLVCQLCQFGMKNRLKFSSSNVEAFIMEAKQIQGYGMTLDVILVNGEVHEGDTIIVVQNSEVIVSKIKFILVPPSMAEVRIKVPLKNVSHISGTRAIKITLQSLSSDDNIQIGLPLPCCSNPSHEEIEKMKKSVNISSQINSLQGITERGVHLQSSTIGSLEALISFLKSAKIDFSSVNIGDVHKKDVLKASAMLESSPMHAVILAFDVKIDRDASDLAAKLGVKIFSANIIYHLYDQFTKYVLEYRESKKRENWSKAIFPCVLRILPQYVFNKSDPLVCGVVVESGQIHTNTKLRVFTKKENFSLGIITSIEMEKKSIDKAVKGDEVSIKVVGDAHQKVYGRHYNCDAHLISDLTRDSIDVLKTYFRDEMSKEYWMLVKQLKLKLSVD